MCHVHALDGHLMSTSMKSHRARDTVKLLQRETLQFILAEMWSPNSSDVNPVDYSVWNILQERVYRSQIHDVKELKEHLQREWRQLDHSIIITAATAQWHTHLSACVCVNDGHFAPMTFWCVLFVPLILVSINLIDVNICKVLILRKMCYFCV